MTSTLLDTPCEMISPTTQQQHVVRYSMARRSSISTSSSDKLGAYQCFPRSEFPKNFQARKHRGPVLHHHHSQRFSTPSCVHLPNHLTTSIGACQWKSNRSWLPLTGCKTFPLCPFCSALTFFFIIHRPLPALVAVSVSLSARYYFYPSTLAVHLEHLSSALSPSCSTLDVRSATAASLVPVRWTYLAPDSSYQCAGRTARLQHNGGLLRAGRASFDHASFGTNNYGHTTFTNASLGNTSFEYTSSGPANFGRASLDHTSPGLLRVFQDCCGEGTCFGHS